MTQQNTNETQKLTPAELEVLRQQHKDLVTGLEKLEYELYFAEKK